MKIVCAWCGKDMGEKPGGDEKEITHGICDECKAKYFPVKKEVAMPRDKEIKKVTFVFEDGSEKVLEGKDLLNWEVICLFHSDYLLPGGPDHILASSAGGMIKGFVPAGAVDR